jgi:uncharacterized protein YlxW (UPF0749 family)
MTDPDDTAGGGTPGRARGRDDRGGTTSAVPPPAEEEPTVPFVAFPPADGDEPTVSLAGRDLTAVGAGDAAPDDETDRDRPVARDDGADRDRPAVLDDGADRDRLVARDDEADRDRRATWDEDADRDRAAEPSGAGADRVAGGGPAEEGERAGAPAVPLGDLALGAEGAAAVAAPRTGEASDTSPDPSISGAAVTPPAESDLGRPRIRRPAPAGTLIWVLLALLGFTLVVQLRSNDADDGLAATRQEDLVRILSDLESEDSRLLAQIQALEQSKQQLNSEVGGREAALAEAERRSQDLGLLAGTVPGRGPGLDITLSDVRASDVLNTVQELRGAGGEVMQLNGANGVSVRLVASSFFVDASGGGIIADGEELTGPFHLLVIGPASTMSTALQIPGGVVAQAKSDGGSVTMDSRSLVEVTAVRKAAALRYARPVS